MPFSIVNNLEMTKTEKHKHIRYEKEEKVKLIKRTEEDEIIDEVDEYEDDNNREKQSGCAYCCKKMWIGYIACLEGSIMGVYNCIVGIKNGICNCLGCLCYPIKQRFCDCCEDVDKDLNPFKNPNYNPYDHL